MLAKYPFSTNCATYGVLYIGAEFSQQFITRKILAKPKQDIDYASVGRFGAVGTIIYAPSLYYWYKWLDKKFPGTAPKTIVKKMLIDQFTITPVLLVIFYVTMAIMEGQEDKFKELKHKYFPTFIRSCFFWMPAQAINFLFIPSNIRVIYVGMCSFVWINILCWIKRQSVPEDSKKK